MTDLILTSPASIEVVATGKKSPRVDVLAYSGGVMNPSGFGDVVIDLQGMEMPENVTLLADHEAKLAGVIGSGRPVVRAGQLHVSGTIADSDAGRKTIQLARDGVELQASVGATVLGEGQFVKAGETVRVNGRDIKSSTPFTLYAKSRLREVSILPLGADHTTAVQITAKRGMDSMSETATQTAEEIRAEERQRLQTIEASTRGDWGTHQARVDELRAKAVSGEIEVAELNSELLGIVRASRPTAPNASPGRPEVPSLTIIEAAAMIHAGNVALAEKEYGERVCQQAEELRANSLVELMAMGFKAEGQSAPRTRNDMIRAAFSTTSLPNVFSNVANKSLMAAYREAPATWRGFASIKNVNDFKDNTSIRPSFVGEMEQLAPGGEIKHGTLDEATFSFSVDTFAKMFSIDRQSIVDDDTGFLSETPSLMATMAARKVSDLVWTTILDAGASYFDASLNNVLTGAEAPLGIDSLAAAIALVRKQKDAENNDLDIVPDRLVVSPDLEATAKQLLESMNVVLVPDSAAASTVQMPDGNPVRNALKLEVEPRLANTTKFTNADADEWFLFGGPTTAPIIVAYLQGQQAPTVEFFGLDHDVKTLGVSWRVFHDFGCALGDYRAAARATPA